MSDSSLPDNRPDCVFELDDVQGSEVEAVPCQDAITALLARRTTESISVDSMLSEFTDSQIDIDDDRDCPAA